MFGALDELRLLLLSLNHHDYLCKGNGKGEPITIYVKKSVFDAHYPTGKWSQTWTYLYGEIEKTSSVEFDVSYEVPVTMTNAQGEGIMYKTLCRDFDVDLRHTNDNLPEGVEPLRAPLRGTGIQTASPT